MHHAVCPLLRDPTPLTLTVPIGNNYSIENVSPHNEARLFFAQARKIRATEEEEEDPEEVARVAGLAAVAEEEEEGEEGAEEEEGEEEDEDEEEEPSAPPVRARKVVKTR